MEISNSSAYDLISGYSYTSSQLKTETEEETTTTSSTSTETTSNDSATESALNALLGKETSTDIYESEAEELRAIADNLIANHKSAELSNYSNLMNGMLGTNYSSNNTIDFSGLLTSVYSSKTSYTAADFGLVESSNGGYSVADKDTTDDTTSDEVVDTDDVEDVEE